ncbi:MAG TPA: hypothetical protein VD884_07275 [Ohtaekwangia sp.]|nr:hypothetical protein [Ohtaekwangia sp.]
MDSHYKYPLVKLPHKIDYCVFLIKEELKSRRFFEGLRSVGLDDARLQPHLDLLILNIMGLDDGSDETAELYLEIMGRGSKKIDSSNESIVTQALKIYMQLRAERKRRKKMTKQKK